MNAELNFKPEVIQGNRVIEPPKSGERYWAYYINKRTQFEQVIETVWNGCMIDRKRLQEGRIFTSKAKAVAAIDAL